VLLLLLLLQAGKDQCRQVHGVAAWQYQPEIPQVV
jgi:hypothetical protein